MRFLSALKVAESPFPVVARDALILRPNSVFLYVVDDQNLARRCLSPWEMASRKTSWSKGQLSPNDKVVVRGERLEDSNTVVILDGKENPSPRDPRQRNQ